MHIVNCYYLFGQNYYYNKIRFLYSDSCGYPHDFHRTSYQYKVTIICSSKNLYEIYDFNLCIRLTMDLPS